MNNPVKEFEPQQHAPAAGESAGVYSGYSAQPKPLNAHLGVIGAYLGLALAASLVLKRSKRELPAEVPVRDIALIGVATHKLSRLITHEEVTSPLRAPFSRLEEETGASEVVEAPRGEGVRYTIGELLSCPFCLGTWIGSALMTSYVFWPRQTRVVASLCSAVAVSDFLNHGYVKAKQSHE